MRCFHIPYGLIFCTDYLHFTWNLPSEFPVERLQLSLIYNTNDSDSASVADMPVSFLHVSNIQLLQNESVKIYLQRMQRADTYFHDFSTASIRI